ncbi:hypothetical protein K450DRAFT_226152 [Umbelopsis ramanniana AG]|uniref:DUF1793-domain-containing protein n=1 Tax=Umbelopsis ramanniana AG TaxID=1314678 RepID=A0AAD5EFX5_UMBRA|nr:uncharacterized protein K450DRAFT_226152 [Umbelopsis ramanniana AG]KAI8582627.1 hypothetical protein K450DRAFT_226152 [Umbelopsis ramanniana AG]
MVKAFNSWIVLLGTFTATVSAVAQYASTIRAPAYPLAVRQPYVSTWLEANNLPGSWPTFWTGKTKGWEGIVRVDGTSYEILGAASTNANITGLKSATQKSVTTTPTQTIFTLAAGPVNVVVTFLSPVEYNDLQRQSIPLSYMLISVASNDGNSHSVQVYSDISGEWASNDVTQAIQWALTGDGSVNIWTSQLQTQTQFAENSDYPTWGQAVFAASTSAKYASGQDTTIRNSFISSGSLGNTNDGSFRCVQCNWPVFAFSYNVGTVTSTASAPVEFVIGHVRPQNIQFDGSAMNAYWKNYWTNANDMVNFFYGDLSNAQTTANSVDTKILTDAYNNGGQSHADIVAFSLRQAFGGTELSGSTSDPYAFLKEISSDGNVNTVDVTYPATPMFYYLSPVYLTYLLKPIFYQCENGYWSKPFAEHDAGSSYPVASGHANGQEEDMPIEESANVILMVANYILNPSTASSDAVAYANQHYSILSTWATYLYQNTLQPTNQLTTDDFTGTTTLNSGLALKGILAMGAFSNIAKLTGHTNDSSVYSTAAQAYMTQWIDLSQSADKSHLMLEYISDGYEFKYNALQDRVLKLGLIPTSIYTEEANYYLTKETTYGIPFVSTHTYTKSDWEMWTAAAFGPANPTLSSHIIADISKYLQNTASRVPFSDWYDCSTAASAGFLARPVVGGHFAILAAAKSGSGTGTISTPGTPFKAGTYTVKVGGGRSGCNQYLSSASCGSDLVDFYGSDDGSGRQRWTFGLVSGQTNVYTIQVSGGRSGCNTYLSSASCGSDLVDLYGSDDGSGRQRWLAVPVPGTTNQYNFMVSGGRATCDLYLSGHD